MAIELYVFIWIILGILVGFINLMFAIQVFQDASKLKQATGKPAFLVGELGWCFTTIFFGVFAVAIYWLIHYSALTPDKTFRKSKEV